MRGLPTAGVHSGRFCLACRYTSVLDSKLPGRSDWKSTGRGSYPSRTHCLPSARPLPSLVIAPSSHVNFALLVAAGWAPARPNATLYTRNNDGRKNDTSYTGCPTLPPGEIQELGRREEDGQRLQRWPKLISSGPKNSSPALYCRLTLGPSSCRNTIPAKGEMTTWLGGLADP